METLIILAALLGMLSQLGSMTCIGVLIKTYKESNRIRTEIPLSTSRNKKFLSKIYSTTGLRKRIYLLQRINFYFIAFIAINLISMGILQIHQHKYLFFIIAVVVKVIEINFFGYYKKHISDTYNKSNIILHNNQKKK